MTPVRRLLDTRLFHDFLHMGKFPQDEIFAYFVSLLKTFAEALWPNLGFARHDQITTVEKNGLANQVLQQQISKKVTQTGNFLS